ncbi:MFS general substrate transporter-63 [Coleophoma crateriformis]|uniref:MFS general substrate transporter-63 n=1 Tax=Coleophoma crateriformis TaxID=565419 RepID=A0A3D8Q3H8_9HELO|nr:MFS general substrate transporter-63 [Coleophoma crateriformis]
MEDPKQQGVLGEQPARDHLNREGKDDPSRVMASEDAQIDVERRTSKPEPSDLEAPVVTKETTSSSAIPYSIFTPVQKALIVAVVSFAATFTGFASNIYFPVIPTIALDLGVSSELINLTVTSYMIFQGLSPTIWGAIADAQGRRLTYIFCFIVFFGACVGLAETKHYYQLVILRCVQSTGSASTVAIGAGVIGDITKREERGGYMGYFQAGLLVPLAIGPVLGGVFAGTLGWRAIFWFLTIYSGVFLMILIIVLPETLRSMVGNGSVPARGVSKSPLSRIMQKRHPEMVSTESLPNQKRAPINFLGPLQILCGREVVFIVVFVSLYYTIWQMTVTVMSSLFASVYGLGEIEIGLTYIANGVGTVLGTLTTGKFLDFEYGRAKRSHTGAAEDFPLERARLRSMWITAGIQCVSVLIFGWTLQYRVHIAVPIVCSFFLGYTAVSIYSAGSTFLVDVFPNQAASATAAVNLVRCLMGAGGTAAVLPISNAIGVGRAFTLFTGLMVAGLGFLVVQLRHGARWRRELEKKLHE